MTYADTEHVEDAEHTVRVSAGSVMLDGTLQVPSAPSGIVLFAHGSGRSRFSPRNRYVAQVLRTGGLATLLVDLLTAEEEQVDLCTRHIRFDIELLAERVAAAASTLLIVGGDDGQVIELNEFALRRMHTAMQTAEHPLEVQLKITPGATHLFEEPGALEQVAVLSRDWFVRHLTLAPTAPVAHSQIHPNPWDNDLQEYRRKLGPACRCTTRNRAPARDRSGSRSADRRDRRHSLCAPW